MLRSNLSRIKHFGLKEKRVGGEYPIFCRKVVLKIYVLNDSFFGAIFLRKRINSGNTRVQIWQRHGDALGLCILLVCGRKGKINLWISLKSFCIRNGGTHSIYQCAGIVCLLDGLCEIPTAPNIYRSRKPRVRAAFRILIMAPPYIIDTTLTEIREATLAVYKAFITRTYVSSIFIS